MISDSASIWRAFQERAALHGDDVVSIEALWIAGLVEPGNDFKVVWRERRADGEGDAVGVAAEQADVGAVVGEDEFAAQVERDMRRFGAGVVERDHVGKVALDQETVLFGGR